MKKTTINIIACAALISLIACGGTKKALISSADINSAKQAGTLASLFDKAEKLKNESSGSTKKEMVQIQSQIADLLVKDRTQQVDQVLANKTEYGFVDKVSLDNLNLKIANMKRWDLANYNKLAPKVSQALNVTNKEIQKAQSSAAAAKVDLVVRMAALKKAAILSGKASAEERHYQETLEKNINLLSKQGRDAYKKRMYNIALESASKGLLIDPQNLQFDSLKSQSEAALFEQKFRAALENGKPEIAYQALVAAKDKPIMLQLKKKMKRSILLLANYFAGNAQASYRKNHLFVAYSEFKRGRDVQQILSSTNIGFVQEKQYLDILMKKVNELPENHGEKMGLLQIIKEFDPGYPQLDENLKIENESLSNRATTKLAVTEFKEVTSNNSVVASVGRRISSKLEKILFEKLGNQLQIVADVNQSEVSGPFSGVSLAIKGEVLQAAIETTKNHGERSLNVQTGLTKTETEAYTKWKKRKRGEMPVQFDEHKIMSDVMIKIEHIKKIAIIEAAYRIVEPSTQKVLLTNNLVKEAKHTGDSTNELQKGMFHQPYIEADLPSDIKIMDNLASQLSEELGQSLEKFLAKPEDVFYQKYKSYLERGEIKNGIEMLANAIVMGSGNGNLQPEWQNELTKLVLEN